MPHTEVTEKSDEILILFENQIQTTSASPYRTQVQPAASFLVCSLIFIEYKKIKTVENGILLFPNCSSFYRFEEIKNLDKVNK